MKIVVRGANWIGDAVMSVPAMREMRRLFPDAFIALHSRSWAKDIFADSALFDEMIDIGQAGHKISSPLRQAGELKKRGFDLSVLFTNSFSTAFVSRIAGVKRRFGYATDGRSFLLSDAVAVPDWKDQRHEVFYYLNLVNQMGSAILGVGHRPAGDPQLEIPVSSGRRAAARERIDALGHATGPTIAMAAGSANSRAKRWLAENFASLNDRLQGDLGAKVLLLGAPDEVEIADRVSTLSRHKPFDLTGQTSLSEAAAILSEVDLAVSNDMGLAHLAPAVGTDTIVIFGPTDHVTTRPFSPRAEVVRAGVECSPCMLRDCPIDHRCMTLVSVESVLGRIIDRLERN